MELCWFFSGGDNSQLLILLTHSVSISVPRDFWVMLSLHSSLVTSLVSHFRLVTSAGRFSNFLRAPWLVSSTEVQPQQSTCRILITTVVHYHLVVLTWEHWSVNVSTTLLWHHSNSLLYLHVYMESGPFTSSKTNSELTSSVEANPKNACISSCHEAEWNHLYEVSFSIYLSKNACRIELFPKSQDWLSDLQGPVWNGNARPLLKS